MIPENELSKEAGVNLDPITSGPIVDESMSTSVEGIFACGNVVHVHDLVDYVTRESETAGNNAAKFIKENKTVHGNKAAPESYEKAKETFQTIPGKGVRYIVPHQVNKKSYQKGIKFFFRSDDVYQNARIVVKCGQQTLCSVKRQKISPGEMEILELNPFHLTALEACNSSNDGLMVELEI